MNLILIKVLVAVALVAGLVFGWNWHINRQPARSAARVKQQNTTRH